MTETSEPQQTNESQQSVSTYTPQVQKEISLGNREYALKNYEKAVEHYGQASELQYSSVIGWLNPVRKDLVQMIRIFYSSMARRYSKSRKRTVKFSAVHLQRIPLSV